MSKICKQMALVMADIQAIGKNGENVKQRFAFRKIDDIYNSLHSILSNHGVFTLPEVIDFKREEKQTQSGSVMTYTVSRVKYHFYADDGSHIESVLIGEGADVGDKSASKSLAMAHKYALTQAFLIPTDEPDPDSQTMPESKPATIDQERRAIQAAKPLSTSPDCGALCEACGTKMIISKAGTSFYCPNFKAPTTGEHSRIPVGKLEEFISKQKFAKDSVESDLPF